MLLLLRLGRVSSLWLQVSLALLIILSAPWIISPVFAQAHAGEEGAGTPYLTCLPAHLRPQQATPMTASCVERLVPYPLEQLRPGLRGVGLTVVSGREIEAFDVEIFGLMEGAGPVGPLVLVRVGGDVIERSGGIAAGMSGSPVYVDGKLVGAIGYGFEMTDHRIGLVTPAESMLALLAEVSADEPPGNPDRAPFDGPQGHTLPQPISAQVRPLKTPVTVAGLGERALQHLKRAMETYDVTAVPGGHSSKRPANAPRPLQPGDAVGVQLVRGDIDVTAVGTVTAVDSEGNFVAFGHPFLRKGAVEFLATRAEVLRSIPSLSFPFKLAVPTEVIGRVARDRGAGISGEQGVAAQTVTLSVRTTDGDRRLQQAFSAEVVADESLLVSLLTVAALEGLDRGIDRIGAGTSSVELSLRSGDSARDVHRTNMYYSSSDVAALSLSDFASALRMLQSNAFINPDLQSVELVVHIQEARKTAQIERAEPSRSEVALGETIDVEVTLRPYRSDPIREVVRLHIPQEIGTGNVRVTVRGGEYAFHPLPPDPLDPLAGGESTEEYEPETPAGVESLEHLIEEFEQQPRNNDLIIEFYPPLKDDEASSGFEESEPEAEFALDESMDSVEPIRKTHSTTYLLRGEKSFTLTLTEPL